MNKSTITRNDLENRERNVVIAMPPLEEIQQVHAALQNEQAPSLGVKKQATVPQEQIQQLDFPTTDLNSLPLYDESYAAQEYNLPQEQDQPVEQTQYEQPEPTYQKQVQVQQEETVQARNFRELRQQAAEAARERDELRAYIRNLEQQKAAPKVEIEAEEPEQEFNFDPEDLASGKQLNEVAKYVKKLEKKIQITKQQSLEAQRIAQEAEIERNLRRMYPDFDNVVTAENLAALRESFGPLAASISADPNLFNKANAAYMAIKNTGIAKPALTTPLQQQQARVSQNMAKPRPVASLAPQQGASPLQRANAFSEGLTEDLQKQLIKEMNFARRSM